MSDHLEQTGASVDKVVPYGLLLTGEGMAFMTPERLRMIEQTVGTLGLHVTMLASVSSASASKIEIGQPIPVGRSDFLEFAENSELTERIAALSWLSVVWTGVSQQQDPQLRAFPPVEFLDNLHDVAELNSIENRLVASRYSRDAWVKGTAARVGFLRRFVEAKLDRT